jgi:hypothetical protein
MYLTVFIDLCSVLHIKCRPHLFQVFCICMSWVNLWCFDPFSCLLVIECPDATWRCTWFHLFYHSVSRLATIELLHALERASPWWFCTASLQTFVILLDWAFGDRFRITIICWFQLFINVVNLKLTKFILLLVLAVSVGLLITCNDLVLFISTVL